MPMTSSPQICFLQKGSVQDKTNKKMTFDTDLVLKYLQIVECKQQRLFAWWRKIRTEWLSAITSLIIRTFCLVNWLSHRYFDLIWWSINKQPSSVRAVMHYPYSIHQVSLYFNKNIGVWCIWCEDQPHWAHLTAGGSCREGAGNCLAWQAEMCSRECCLRFWFFFFWQLTVIRMRGQDCSKTSRNMVRHREHVHCRNQEGVRGVDCSLVAKSEPPWAKVADFKLDTSKGSYA